MHKTFTPLPDSPISAKTYKENQETYFSPTGSTIDIPESTMSESEISVNSSNSGTSMGATTEPIEGAITDTARASLGTGKKLVDSWTIKMKTLGDEKEINTRKYVTGVFEWADDQENKDFEFIHGGLHLFYNRNWKKDADYHAIVSMVKTVYKEKYTNTSRESKWGISKTRYKAKTETITIHPKKRTPILDTSTATSTSTLITQASKTRDLLEKLKAKNDQKKNLQ